MSVRITQALMARDKAGPSDDDLAWKSVSFRLSPSLLQAIDVYMAGHGVRDRSDLVRLAISEFIKFVPTQEELRLELERLRARQKKRGE